MNVYNISKPDRYNRGLLARPSPRYSPNLGVSSYQRNHLGTNQYVSSEASEALPVDEYDYLNDQAYTPYDSAYDYSLSSRLPIDEHADGLKRAAYQQQFLQQRTPGYVTSFDTTPSHPNPHSSLTSRLTNNPSYYGQNSYPLENSLPYSGYLQPGGYDDGYGAFDWSSDGSSDSSQGPGRHARHRHRGYGPTPGQTRLTDLGREVFNGFAWVSEEDYATDGGAMMSNISAPLGYGYSRHY